jgi:60 kDa SS-A/Ro ribonucleoprotein
MPDPSGSLTGSDIMTTASVNTAGVAVSNNAGGIGYARGPESALAQLAMTGCFNNTFYVSGVNQMDKVLELAKACEPSYVAKLAVYSRKNGMMKDMPAFLTAYIASLDPALLKQVFPHTIDNGKMLRNFVQVMRSGAVGRKSLGSAPRRLVRDWFESRSDMQVIRNSVGTNPSMLDVIKMVHPKPASASRKALYAWFIGKPYEESDLPEELRNYQAFNKTESWEGPLPNVPYEMLQGDSLTDNQWKLLAEQATWSQTRQALNTFHRHGVFSDPALVKSVVEKLRNEEQIRRAKVFPYQLMTAYLNINSEIPAEIGLALRDAMEIATANVPVLEGAVYVCPDVSGSMSSYLTGARLGKSGKPGATSKVRCIDIAALVAASILRTNPHAEVIPFEGDIRPVKLNPKATVMANAEILAGIGGGSTACSAPMKHLNSRKAPINAVIYISDNESWKDVNYASYYGSRSSGTTLNAEWLKARDRCPEAKLVSIDITPNDTTQVNDRDSSLNVGGFSDDVFSVASNFLTGSGQHWVDQIKSTAL